MDGWIEGWIGTVAWIDGWIDRCHMYVCMYSIPVSEIVIPLLKLLVQPDKDLFIYIITCICYSLVFARNRQMIPHCM